MVPWPLGDSGSHRLVPRQLPAIAVSPSLMLVFLSNFRAFSFDHQQATAVCGVMERRLSITPPRHEPCRRQSFDRVSIRQALPGPPMTKNKQPPPAPDACPFRSRPCRSNSKNVWVGRGASSGIFTTRCLLVFADVRHGRALLGLPDNSSASPHARLRSLSQTIFLFRGCLVRSAARRRTRPSEDTVIATTIMVVVVVMEMR